MVALTELQSWYESQCDEEWERHFGVEINSLDNPGWWVKTDLAGTALEGKPFREISDLNVGREWLRCWVEDAKFQGVGGPQMLEKILEIFLAWARPEAGERDGEL